MVATAAISESSRVVTTTPAATIDTDEARARETVPDNTRPEQAVLLGYEINWNVSGALVSRGDLADRLAAEGLGDHLPRRPPTAKRALRRAIAEWAAGRAGVAFRDDEDAADISRRRKLIREIRGLADRGEAAPVLYALVEEASLGGALGLKYATSYRFRYQPPQRDEDGAGGQLTVTSTASGPFARDELSEVDAQIRPLWEKHKDLYTGADLSELLIGVVHGAAGISVEAGTGVWFVPASQEATIGKLERLVRGLAAENAGVHLRVRENIDWPRTRAALAEAATDDILAEIARARAELERFEGQQGEKPGSVKIGTVKGLLAEFLAIQDKAALYAETVGLRRARLDEELTGLGARALDIARVTRAARATRLAGGEALVVPTSDTPRAARLA